MAMLSKKNGNEPATRVQLDAAVHKLDRKIDIMASAVVAVDRKIDIVASAVVAVDRKIDRVASEVVAVDRKIDRVASEVVAVDRKIDRVASEVVAGGRLDNKIDALGAEMRRGFDRIMGVMDSFLGRLETYDRESLTLPKMLDAHGKRLDMHENRISALEKGTG